MQERWKPNVTVAAIIELNGRYLLVEEHTPEGLRLNNPAGHLDPHESLVTACARETLEETAHSFVPNALVGVYLSRFQRAATGEDITYLRFAFSGVLGAHIPHLTLDHGIVRTLWLTREEVRACLHAHRSPLVMQCIDDHANGYRWPLEVLHTQACVSSGAPSGAQANAR
jgi:ADP-ribose pyrophosphatase YjhB (NUDIX family)